MKNKEFDQLSTKEKFRLQKIVKNKQRSIPLTSDEEEIYTKFHERYDLELKKAKSKWPLIILLIISSLFAVLRSCN